MPDLTTYDYDIFLSHNRADQEWTAKLAERLEAEDWPKQNRKLKVFFSPWDIRPGQSIPAKIEKALPKSRKVGLILSPDAVDSAWVELERLVTTYIDISERGERLIPIYRRDCEIPALLRPILYLDFRDDAAFEESYRTFLLVIKDEPLPRRSPTHVTNSTVAPPSIPRPPIVGFVARRDGEGRDIVERLQEELAPQKNQLIALSGPGGVGKTTLASETARALTEKHTQRVVWVGADGRDDFTLSTLLDEIAGQLGRIDLRPLPTDAKAEELRALIATVPTLIILDNLETVSAAEQSRCVGFLLNRAPCPVLITTRPKIPSARNVIIPVMSRDEANNFLQLLIEQAADPSAFANLDRDRIMTVSDRNPLVMQWVVAQIDLAQEASTVLDELAHGIGDAAERVFDRSFKLAQLGDDSRAVLLALSLFAPDASRPVLAETAGFGEDVKRLNETVGRLASLWLIKTTTEGQRLSVDGLTRELAKARLMRDSLSHELRQRFVAFFLNYARTHADPTPEDYEALETEKDNLLGAMDVAFDMQDWSTVQGIAYALALPVNGLLSVHGYWDEAIRRNQQALRAARESSSEIEVSKFAHNSAVIHQHRGEIEEARELYNESLKINKKLGDQSGIATSLHQLARLAQDQGELDEARRLYNESLEIEKNLGSQSGIAISLHQLATLAQDQREPDEARRLYNESLEIKKRLGDQSGIAKSLHQLAMLAQDHGEPDEARQLYNESLEIKKRLGDQSGIAKSLHQLAMLAQEHGEPDEARQLYNESLEIKKRLGDHSGIAITLAQLGTLAEEEGNAGEAAQLFSEALAIFQKLKSPNAELARQDLERVQGKSS